MAEGLVAMDGEKGNSRLSAASNVHSQRCKQTLEVAKKPSHYQGLFVPVPQPSSKKRGWDVETDHGVCEPPSLRQSL